MNDGIKEFYGRNIKEEIARMEKTSDILLKIVEQQDRIIEEVARLSLSPLGRFLFDHSKKIRRMETDKYKIVHNHTGYDIKQKKDGTIVATVEQKQINITLGRY